MEGAPAQDNEYPVWIPEIKRPFNLLFKKVKRLRWSVRSNRCLAWRICTVLNLRYISGIALSFKKAKPFYLLMI